MSRDITIEDQEAWVEHSSRQRFATRMLAELDDERVSRFEAEEEGAILGAARWLALCIVFVGLAAVSAMWGVR
jgi:hypothetical protein